MEALDSALFPIEGIVDFRALGENPLHREITALEEGLESRISEVISSLYPHITATVSCRSPSPDDLPAYPGKRHILKEEA